MPIRRHRAAEGPDATPTRERRPTPQPTRRVRRPPTTTPIVGAPLPMAEPRAAAARAAWRGVPARLAARRHRVHPPAPCRWTNLIAATSHIVLPRYPAPRSRAASGRSPRYHAAELQSEGEGGKGVDALLESAAFAGIQGVESEHPDGGGLCGRWAVGPLRDGG